MGTKEYRIFLNKSLIGVRLEEGGLLKIQTLKGESMYINEFLDLALALFKKTEWKRWSRRQPHAFVCRVGMSGCEDYALVTERNGFQQFKKILHVSCAGKINTGFVGQIQDLFDLIWSVFEEKVAGKTGEDDIVLKEYVPIELNLSSVIDDHTSNAQDKYQLGNCIVDTILERSGEYITAKEGNNLVVFKKGEGIILRKENCWFAEISDNYLLTSDEEGNYTERIQLQPIK